MLAGKCWMYFYEICATAWTVASVESRASQKKMDDSLRSNWTVRLLARHRIFRQAFEIVASLKEGYRSSMERSKDALAQFDVREIACEGQHFDPNSMHAVDVEETDQQAEGTVLEVRGL